ncbi:MAG: orotate phosphoribosyltransferase [Candidatus Hadarchaeia archaeon]
MSKRILEEKEKEIASELKNIDAIKFGEFELTSGKSSPYYLDLRTIPSHPPLFDLLTEECAKIIDSKIGDEGTIAGVPTAGLPFASVISYKLKMPLVYVREEKKRHGTKSAIEGDVKGEVILIDDLTTTGGSISSAAKTLRNAGANVENALVMVEREEGAEKNLKNIGINLHFLTKVSDIIKYLRETSKISDKEYRLVNDYLESNK